MYPYQNTIPVGHRIWYIVLDEEVVGASFAALNSNCLHGSWLKPGGFVFLLEERKSEYKCSFGQNVDHWIADERCCGSSLRNWLEI
jgi:hypothetical protein